MNSRLHVVISGDVQGVFFRAGARGEAQKLSLTGWVRNTDDGSVEVMAEGERDALEQLLQWCYHGPAGASVSNVVYVWLESTGEFSDFHVRYG